MKLPAISLWQPWASLLFVPDAKVHETRSWSAPRGPIGKTVLIHAAKTREGLRDIDPSLEALCRRLWGPIWQARLPKGAFIGRARLAESFLIVAGNPRWASGNDHLCGDWTPGRYAWRFDDRTAFAIPIPAKGQQGWWTAETPDAP